MVDKDKTTTTIEVSRENWQKLSGEKWPGESFDDVVDRLLDELGGFRTARNLGVDVDELDSEQFEMVEGIPPQYAVPVKEASSAEEWIEKMDANREAVADVDLPDRSGKVESAATGDDEERIRCQHCGNIWVTSSAAERPSCSSCGYKTDRVEP